MNDKESVFQSRVPAAIGVTQWLSASLTQCSGSDKQELYFWSPPLKGQYCMNREPTLVIALLCAGLFAIGSHINIFISQDILSQWFFKTAFLNLLMSDSQHLLKK